MQRNPGKLRTGKLILPTLIPGEPRVHYIWRIDSAHRTYALRIAQVARHLRALGWGIDLAIGHGEVFDGPRRAVERGLTELRPLLAPNHRGQVLRIPTPGSLDALERAYAASLTRVSPDGTLRDDPGGLVYAQVMYGIGAARPYVTFALQKDDEDIAPCRVRPGRIKALVGMVRAAAAAPEVVHAIGEERVNRVILGHPRDANGPRISFLPLPSIGHRHSDGLVRRVLIAEALGSDGALCKTLGNLLHRRPLRADKPDEDFDAILKRIDHPDSVIRTYTNCARTWASVTPVLLPGFDDRRQHRGNHRKRLDRAEELVCKAMHHVGIDMSADIELSRVPYWPGTLHARDYEPRDKLAHYPRWHVRLTFDHAMSGPLALGAGRHVGFGVMAAAED